MKCSVWYEKGFTLIEVMIVVAIIAILAAVAYPSYEGQVRKSRRADAQAVLMEAAQFMERSFTTNNTYNVALPAGLQQSPKDGGTVRYNLGFNPAPTAAAFTLQAVPVTADPDCGTITINQAGLRGATGPLGANACWKR